MAGLDGMDVKMLYGENMMASFPQNIVDVSLIRDVPDNQEVFTHPISDQSIMVDILQYVDEPDEEALNTHFNELASGNDAENSGLTSIEAIPGNKLSMQGCGSAYFFSGQQMVSKFNESSKNMVQMYMTLFRFPDRETDILVTMNDPFSISQQSSSHNPEGAANIDKWSVEQFRAVVFSLKLLQPDFLG